MQNRSCARGGVDPGAHASWVRIRGDAQAHGMTAEGEVCVTLKKD
jgi:hypothetical protein